MGKYETLKTYVWNYPEVSRDDTFKNPTVYEQVPKERLEKLERTLKAREKLVEVLLLDNKQLREKLNNGRCTETEKDS